MYLRKVISFGKSWEKLDKRSVQVNDIIQFISKVSMDSIRATPERFSSTLNDKYSGGYFTNQ